MAYKKHVIGLAVMSALAMSAQAGEYGPFNGGAVNITNEDIVNIKNAGTGAAIDQTASGSSLSILDFTTLLITAQQGSAYVDQTGAVESTFGVMRGKKGVSSVTFESDGTNSPTINLNPGFPNTNKVGLTVEAGTITVNQNHQSDSTSHAAIAVYKDSELELTANTININSVGSGLNAFGTSRVTLTADTINVKSVGGAVIVSGNAKLELNASTITLTSLYMKGTGTPTGRITIGSESGTTLNMNGDISVERSQTLELNNTRVIVKAGEQIEVSNLEGSNATFVFNSLTNTNVDSEHLEIVRIDNNQNDSLTLLLSGELTETAASPEELAKAFLAVARLDEEGKPIAMAAEAGETAGGFTFDAQGELTPNENPSMAAVGHFSAMNLAQWRGEVDLLTDRLGDLRVNPQRAGGWARISGYENDISTSVSVQSRSTTVQAGGDVRLDDHWVLGGAFSYTSLDADFSNGEGSADGYSLAAYLSGFFDCGGYVDVVARAGRLSSDVEADTLSAFGGVLTGDYANNAVGLSVETGYHLPIGSTFFVEPRAQLAYSLVFGDDFQSTTNSVRIEQEDFESLVGLAGARFGALFNEGRGQIYAHAAVHHDFMGDADATATSRWGHSELIRTDLGGTWTSYGLGAQFSLTNGLNFYGMLERSSGSDYEEDYRYSVGVSYRF